MRVRLTVGDQSATATLADNPARDFASLLPLTLTMHNSDWRSLEPCRRPSMRVARRCSPTR